MDISRSQTIPVRLFNNAAMMTRDLLVVSMTADTTSKIHSIVAIGMMSDSIGLEHSGT